MGRQVLVRIVELLPLLLLITILIVRQFQKYGSLRLASDDSYIYLGYAKRAITSPMQLFSYNAGEHSAGTTGMLYYYLLTVVCGLIRWIGQALPIEKILLIGSYTLNCTLFVLCGYLYLSSRRRLLGETKNPWGTALSIALFLAHPKFVWGVFAGMENPLSAVLCILLVHSFLRDASLVTRCLIAAALCGSRPELVIVLFVVPILAAFHPPAVVTGQSSGARALRIARRLVAAYLVWGIGVTILVLPCYFTTGHLFPSAMGTRIHISPLFSPAELLVRLKASWGLLNYWTSPWFLIGSFIFFCSLCLPPTPATRKTAVMIFLVLAFLAARTLFGLWGFDVEDRYVSFFWPLYALGLSVCLEAPWRYVGAARSRALRATALICLAAAIFLPIREFWDRLKSNTKLMNHLVVGPSLWMRDHLPPGTRICMEPAGAIRVFTDHYLVDAIGLTTTHRKTYFGNHLDYLLDHNVEYVFDYSHRVPALMQTGLGTLHKDWAGISLFKIEAAPQAQLSRIGYSDSIPGNSNPKSVFDNEVAGDPAENTGEHYWYAGQTLPASIETEWTTAADVDAIRLRVWGPCYAVQPRSKHTPLDYHFEFLKGGTWNTLKTEQPSIAGLPDGREDWTFTVPGPVASQGIRFVCLRTGSEFSPIINEITLLKDERPIIWRWPATDFVK